MPKRPYNAERQAERQRAFFAAHPEKRAEYRRNRELKHPDQVPARRHEKPGTMESRATAAHYGNYASPDAVRRVWAEVTRTPCASSQEIGARLRIPFSNVSFALRLLRDAGYIAFEHDARHARTVLVPFYVGEPK